MKSRNFEESMIPFLFLQGCRGLFLRSVKKNSRANQKVTALGISQAPSGPLAAAACAQPASGVLPMRLELFYRVSEVEQILCVGKSSL